MKKSFIPSVLLGGLLVLASLSYAATVFAQTPTVSPSSPVDNGSEIDVQPNTDGTQYSWTGNNNLPGEPGNPNGTSNSTTSTGTNTSTYCQSFTGSITLSGSNLSQVIAYLTCFISRLIIPLLFAVALVVFIVGVIKFMQAGGSEEKAEGKQFMLWGVIALAVMLGVWGLVKILTSTFGIGFGLPQLPPVPS